MKKLEVREKRDRKKGEHRMYPRYNLDARNIHWQRSLEAWKDQPRIGITESDENLEEGERNEKTPDKMKISKEDFLSDGDHSLQMIDAPNCENCFGLLPPEALVVKK